MDRRKFDVDCRQQTIAAIVSLILAGGALLAGPESSRLPGPVSIAMAAPVMIALEESREGVLVSFDIDRNGW